MRWDFRVTGLGGSDARITACIRADDVKAAARPPHPKGAEFIERLADMDVSRKKNLGFLGGLGEARRTSERK